MTMYTTMNTPKVKVTELTIGHNYASVFGLNNDTQKLIYNGGISWTAIEGDRTMTTAHFGFNAEKSLPVYDAMPEGWSVNHGAVTAPRGYVLITNGKSFFGGERKSALMEVND